MAVTGYVSVPPLSFVQLQDAGGTAYVSLRPADDNGDWEINAPPGSYTITTGPTALGPWTPLPNVAAYVIQNDQDAGGDLTASGALFPGSNTGAPQKVVGLIAGTGAPNNAVGQDGWLYFRSDGGSLTTVYQRRTGAWVGIV